MVPEHRLKVPLNPESKWLLWKILFQPDILLFQPLTVWKIVMPTCLEWWPFFHTILILPAGFEKSNCELHTLTNYDTLIREAAENNYVSKEQLDTLKIWRLTLIPGKIIMGNTHVTETYVTSTNPPRLFWIVFRLFKVCRPLAWTKKKRKNVTITRDTILANTQGMQMGSRLQKGSSYTDRHGAIRNGSFAFNPEPAYPSPGRRLRIAIGTGCKLSMMIKMMLGETERFCGSVTTQLAELEPGKMSKPGSYE